MTREEIITKISDITLKHFDIEEIQISETLSVKDDLGADSIKIMEFILEIEDDFGIEISDEEAEKLETVGSMIDYIQNNL